MAASDHTSQQQFGPLFHGTKNELAPGDVIEPRSKKWAHATPSLRTARVFGQNVYEVEPVDPHETWTDRMPHTGYEYHWETLGPGFKVVGGPVHKNRTEASYRNRPGDPHLHNLKLGWSYDKDNDKWDHDPDKANLFPERGR